MKKRVEDIAEVRAGYQFRGKVEPVPGGTIRVIQIKDLDDRRGIRTDDLVAVELDKPKPYLARQGDVLFLSRGHRQIATTVTEPLENTIAAGYFFILRLTTEKLAAPYLAWFINQSEFQEAMRPYVRGSHMPLISKADFQQLKIEIPPLDVQQKIVQLHELLRRERSLVVELAEKRAALVEKISLQAAKRKQTQREG